MKIKNIVCLILAALCIFGTMTGFAASSVSIVDDTYECVRIDSTSYTETSGFEADGSAQGYTLTLDNSSASEVNVALILVLFDSNGIIRKMVNTERTLSGNTQLEFGIGTVMDASVADGTAKLYIWDTFANKSPFVTGISRGIDAVTP